MPLAAGFVLGAIVSPPDAIAASAIAQRLGLPRRVVTILEGESLVNDATSLVIFKVALAAVGATAPLIGRAWIPGEFIYVSVGGIVVGLVVGKVIGWLRRRLIDDGPQIALTLSLLTPYVSYLLADQFCHVSGVLSVVATGLYLGWKAPDVLNSGVRLQPRHSGISSSISSTALSLCSLACNYPASSAAWRNTGGRCRFSTRSSSAPSASSSDSRGIFPGAYLPRLIKRIRQTEEKPDWRQVVIVGWAGMRGIVSLAAALTLQGFPDFPRPHIVQFIAFSVILTTLVFQGLTLPPLIRFLGVGDDGLPAREELEARRQISRAVFTKIDELRTEEKFPSSAIDSVESTYRERALLLNDDLADQLGWSDQRHHVLSARRLRRLTIAVQRRAPRRNAPHRTDRRRRHAQDRA